MSRGVIVTDSNMQIPVTNDWFDRLLAAGGTARRVQTNGPGESWFVTAKGEKPQLIVVNSNSEASETLASIRKD